VGSGTKLTPINLKPSSWSTSKRLGYELITRVAIVGPLVPALTSISRRPGSLEARMPPVSHPTRRTLSHSVGGFKATRVSHGRRTELTEIRVQTGRSPFSFSSPADISNAAPDCPQQLALAHFCESWHLQTSSYERTPDLAYYNCKSLSEQWQPIHGLICCRAFSAS